MNSNFKELLNRFSERWKSVTTSSNLSEVEVSFTSLEETRDNVLNWVFDNIQDEAEQGEYLKTFGELESNLMKEMGTIPVFDDGFDINESFDAYESYYQRYGCMIPEFIISWDTKNVLWTDEMTIEVIKRPDVLMSETK